MPGRPNPRAGLRRPRANVIFRSKICTALMVLAMIARRIYAGSSREAQALMLGFFVLVPRVRDLSQDQSLPASLPTWSAES